MVCAREAICRDAAIARRRTKLPRILTIPSKIRISHNPCTNRPMDKLPRPRASNRTTAESGPFSGDQKKQSRCYYAEQSWLG